MFAAYAGAVAAYASSLANLPPEKRREALRRMREARELEALDAEPEVQTARSLIEGDRLYGEHAAMLLDFARDLARRRIS